MRAVIPVLLVVLALSAREYIDLNVPGGLAYADRAAILSLARESAIASLNWAFPSGRATQDSRSMHRRRHQHVRQTENAQLGPIYRIEMRGTTRPGEQPARRRMGEAAEVRLRGFGQRDRSADPDRPAVITFVVPIERKVEAASHRERKRERRR